MYFLVSFVQEFIPKLLDTRGPSDATDNNRSPVIRGVASLESWRKE